MKFIIEYTPEEIELIEKIKAAPKNDRTLEPTIVGEIACFFASLRKGADKVVKDAAISVRPSLSAMFDHE